MVWGYGSSDEEERTDRFKSERCMTKNDYTARKGLSSYASSRDKQCSSIEKEDYSMKNDIHGKYSRSRSSLRKDGHNKRQGSRDKMKYDSYDRSKNDLPERLQRSSADRRRSQNKRRQSQDDFEKFRRTSSDRLHRPKSLERLKHDSYSRATHSLHEKSGNSSSGRVQLRYENNDADSKERISTVKSENINTNSSVKNTREKTLKHFTVSDEGKNSEIQKSSYKKKRSSPEENRSRSVSKYTKSHSPSPKTSVPCSESVISRKRSSDSCRKSDNPAKCSSAIDVSKHSTRRQCSPETPVKLKKCKKKAKLKEKEILEKELSKTSSGSEKITNKNIQTNQSPQNNEGMKIKNVELKHQGTLQKGKDSSKNSSAKEATILESESNIINYQDDIISDGAVEFLCKISQTGDRKKERVYGPSLREESLVDPSQSYGPALPPSMQRCSSSSPCSLGDGEMKGDSAVPSDDDCVYGPALPGTAPDPAHIALQHRAALLQMHHSQESNHGKEHVEREEWMTQLPERGQALGLGLAARTFRLRDTDTCRDESWTDTPEDKARKQQMAKMGSATFSKESMNLDALTKQRDEVMEKISSKHKKDKSKSLLEMHQDKIKKQKKQQDTKPERRPFSREADLNVNQLSHVQKKSIFKKAALLDSRFSSGQAKYL